MAQNRMTKQRTVILEMLRSVHTHPTADELYSMVREKLPKVSLGTVYRNLDLLIAQGEIAKIDKAGTQKRFDGNPRPHFHVRCQMCGKIGDIFDPVSVPSVSGLEIEGFSVLNAEVEFNGICSECQKCSHEA